MKALYLHLAASIVGGGTWLALSAASTTDNYVILGDGARMMQLDSQGNSTPLLYYEGDILRVGPELDPNTGERFSAEFGRPFNLWREHYRSDFAETGGVLDSRWEAYFDLITPAQGLVVADGLLSLRTTSANASDGARIQLASTTYTANAFPSVLVVLKTPTPQHTLAHVGFLDTKYNVGNDYVYFINRGGVWIPELSLGGASSFLTDTEGAAVANTAQPLVICVEMNNVDHDGQAAPPLDFCFNFYISTGNNPIGSSQKGTVFIPSVFLKHPGSIKQWRNEEGYFSKDLSVVVGCHNDSVAADREVLVDTVVISSTK